MNTRQRTMKRQPIFSVYTANLPCRHILSFIIVFITSVATAQELRTSYFQQTSNYRHQMNPALLQDPHIGVLLGNIHVNSTGNMGYRDFIYPLENNQLYTQTTMMHPDISAQEALKRFDENNRADVYLNYNLFSIAFRGFKGVNLVELNIRSENHVALPYQLVQFVKSPGARQQYDLKGIGARTQNYAELALGHTRDINEKWRVGGKIKLLLGVGYADLDAQQLDVTMNGDKWTVNGDVRLKAALSKTTLTNHPEKKAPDGRPRIDKISVDFNGGINGIGIGADIGAVYNPNSSWSLSASITDMGFIQWKKVENASSAGSYTFEGFENINVKGEDNTGQDIGEQFENIGKDLENLFAICNDGQSKHRSSLAATVNIGAQYTIPSYPRLRLGYLLSQRLGKYNYHSSMISANWRPAKWFEANLSTALTSTGLTAGAVIDFHARHFNFFIGCDAFPGKVSKYYIPLNNTNTGISMGMSFPL